MRSLCRVTLFVFALFLVQLCSYASFSQRTIIIPMSPGSGVPDYHLSALALDFTSDSPNPSFWPVRTSAGTPIQYTVFIYLIDSRDGSMHADFSAEHSAHFLAALIRAHPLLSSYQPAGGSVRYNCIAYAIGRTDCWIPTAEWYKYYYDGDFGSVQDEEDAEAAGHDVLLFNPKHLSASVSHRLVQALPPPWPPTPFHDYTGKYGLAPVFTTPRLVVEDIYPNTFASSTQYLSRDP